jgi:hypothetical protein
MHTRKEFKYVEFVGLSPSLTHSVAFYYLQFRYRTVLLRRYITVFTWQPPVPYCRSRASPAAALGRPASSRTCSTNPKKKKKTVIVLLGGWVVGRWVCSLIPARRDISKKNLLIVIFISKHITPGMSVMSVK